MALSDFLTDIADAIREKKGTTALINAQTFADEIRNLPSGEGGSGEVTVIPVDRLPADKDTAFMVENGEVVKTIAGYGIKINIVDVLPETGDVFKGSSELNFYLQKSTMTAHAYVTGNRPGWTTAFGALISLSNTLYFQGVVTDEDEAIELDKFYIVFYAVGYINENAVYKIPVYSKSGNAYLFRNGEKLSAISSFSYKINVVDVLPEEAEVFISGTSFTFYFQEKDHKLYGWGGEEWSSASNIFALGELGTYGGVITSADQATSTEEIYCFYEIVKTEKNTNLYYYREGWKGIGTHIKEGGSGGGTPIIGTLVFETFDGETFPLDAENIYFNINMSTGDVVSVLSSLTYLTGNGVIFGAIPAIIAMCGVELTIGGEALLAIINANGGYGIIDLGGGMLLFGSVENVAEGSGITSDFVGWNPSFVSAGGVIEGNFSMVAPGSDLDGIIIDNQQELYASIISKTPNFGGGDVKITPLSGEFRLNPITITENGTVSLQKYLDNQQLVNEVTVAFAPEKSITITENGTYDVKDYGEAIVNVLFDYNNTYVRGIGDYAFSHVETLKSINCPNITSIGYYAFGNCTNLTSVTIPDSVTSIGGDAFRECESLTSVVIGNSVTSIGDRAFSSCRLLTTITIPDSVTSIGTATFYGCESLTSVVIGDGVTSIGDGAFGECTSLTSVTIPDSVTSIGGSAFRECKSLTSVVIGDGVTSIGSTAFYSCTSLTNIQVLPTTPPTLGSSAFGSISPDAVITVPAGCGDAYKTATNWSEYADMIVEATE